MTNNNQPGGFYYYLPPDDLPSNVDGHLNLERLDKHDLAGVFQNERKIGIDAIVQELTSGPDGKPGTLVYHRPTSEKRTVRGFYSPGQQTWQRFKTYWIGYDNDRKPTSHSLLRRKWLKGVAIEAVGDESQWCAPIIRPVDGQCGSLPETVSWDEDGNMVYSVVDSYRYLWDLSEEIADDIVKPKDEKRPESWYASAAIKILQVNHRINEAGFMALNPNGLFSPDNFVEICLIANQMDFSERVKKKPGLPT